MTAPVEYSRVDIPRDRAADMFAVDGWAFIADIVPDSIPVMTDSLDWSRTRGISPTSGPDAGELVAVHGSFGYTMRTPGGTVATSGLTWVGVHPGHRRRGLLTSMIADHFGRSRARGEAVSTLIAAETAIYQRFGYGIGHHAYKVSLPRGLKLPHIPGSDDLHIRLENASPAAHGAAIRAVLERDTRPGSMAAVDDVLLHDVLKDTAEARRDSEALRIAIVEDEQGPAAFAVFRRRLEWEGTHPDGKGTTYAWAAVTPAAERRLLTVLADLDLMESFTLAVVPTDDPLLSWAPDIRSLKAELRDQVWVRILDVKAALEARAYASDVECTLAVTDAQISENSHPWHLRVVGGVASVERAERNATVDASIDIKQLSSAYLGGITIDQLALAGLVEEVNPGTVHAISDAFASPTAPRSTFFF